MLKEQLLCSTNHFCSRRDERVSWQKHNLSKHIVYVTFVHIPLAGASHMIKPNINEIEMANPLTGKGEQMADHTNNYHREQTSENILYIWPEPRHLGILRKWVRRWSRKAPWTVWTLKWEQRKETDLFWCLPCARNWPLPLMLPQLTQLTSEEANSLTCLSSFKL